MAAWQTNPQTQDAAPADANQSRAEGAQEVDLARLEVERRGAVETISMMAANLRAFLLSRKKAVEARGPARDAACGKT